jgi:hypothetical protein
MGLPQRQFGFVAKLGHAGFMVDKLFFDQVFFFHVIHFNLPILVRPSVAKFINQPVLQICITSMPTASIKSQLKQRELSIYQQSDMQWRKQQEAGESCTTRRHIISALQKILLA